MTAGTVVGKETRIDTVGSRDGHSLGRAVVQIQRRVCAYMKEGEQRLLESSIAKRRSPGVFRSWESSFGRSDQVRWGERGARIRLPTRVI